MLYLKKIKNVVIRLGVVIGSPSVDEQKLKMLNCLGK